MLISNTPPHQRLKPSCKTHSTKHKPKYQFNDKNLNKDTVSFSGKVGNLLDKKALSQLPMFKGELFELLMSEKPVAENFKWLTKYAFKDLKFELKDMKEIKYPDLLKKPPVIFAKSDFNSPQPFTKIFLNTDRISTIRNNAVNPRAHFANYIDEIGKTISSNNECHFISNVVDEFATRFGKEQNISPNSLDRIINDLNNKHSLDLNYQVVHKQDIPELKIGRHAVLTEIGRFGGEIASKFAIDFTRPKVDLNQAVPHEFTHLLNINSKEFQNAGARLSDEQMHKVLAGHSLGLVDIMEKNNAFLKLPTTMRKQEYDKLLGSIIKDNQDINRVNLFAALERLTKDEAMAYCKTPKDVQGSKSYAPLMDTMKDFYNYLLSVKYDATKMAAF